MSDIAQFNKSPIVYMEAVANLMSVGDVVIVEFKCAQTENLQFTITKVGATTFKCVYSDDMRKQYNAMQNEESSITNKAIKDFKEAKGFKEGDEYTLQLDNIVGNNIKVDGSTTVYRVKNIYVNDSLFDELNAIRDNLVKIDAFVGKPAKDVLTRLNETGADYTIYNHYGNPLITRKVDGNQLSTYTYLGGFATAADGSSKNTANWNRCKATTLDDKSASSMLTQMEMAHLSDNVYISRALAVELSDIYNSDERYPVELNGKPIRELFSKRIIVDGNILFDYMDDTVEDTIPLNFDNGQFYTIINERKIPVEIANNKILINKHSVCSLEDVFTFDSELNDRIANMEPVVNDDLDEGGLGILGGDSDDEEVDTLPVYDEVPADLQEYVTHSDSGNANELNARISKGAIEFVDMPSKDVFDSARKSGVVIDITGDGSTRTYLIGDTVCVGNVESKIINEESTDTEFKYSYGKGNFGVCNYSDMKLLKAVEVPSEELPVEEVPVEEHPVEEVPQENNDDASGENPNEIAEEIEGTEEPVVEEPDDVKPVVDELDAAKTQYKTLLHNKKHTEEDIKANPSSTTLQMKLLTFNNAINNMFSKLKRLGLSDDEIDALNPDADEHKDDFDGEHKEDSACDPKEESDGESLAELKKKVYDYLRACKLIAPNAAGNAILASNDVNAIKNMFDENGAIKNEFIKPRNPVVIPHEPTKGGSGSPIDDSEGSDDGSAGLKGRIITRRPHESNPDEASSALREEILSEIRNLCEHNGISDMELLPFKVKLVLNHGSNKDLISLYTKLSEDWYGTINSGNGKDIVDGYITKIRAMAEEKGLTLNSATERAIESKNIKSLEKIYDDIVDGGSIEKYCVKSEESTPDEVSLKTYMQNASAMKTGLGETCIAMLNTIMGKITNADLSVNVSASDETLNRAVNLIAMSIGDDDLYAKLVKPAHDFVKYMKDNKVTLDVSALSVLNLIGKCASNDDYVSALQSVPFDREELGKIDDTIIKLMLSTRHDTDGLHVSENPAYETILDTVASIGIASVYKFDFNQADIDTKLCDLFNMLAINVPDELNEAVATGTFFDVMKKYQKIPFKTTRTGNAELFDERTVVKLRAKIEQTISDGGYRYDDALVDGILEKAMNAGYLASYDVGIQELCNEALGISTRKSAKGMEDSLERTGERTRNGIRGKIPFGKGVTDNTEEMKKPYTEIYGIPFLNLNNSNFSTIAVKYNPTFIERGKKLLEQKKAGKVNKAVLKDYQRKLKLANEAEDNLVSSIKKGSLMRHWLSKVDDEQTALGEIEKSGILRKLSNIAIRWCPVSTHAENRDRIKDILRLVSYVKGGHDESTEVPVTPNTLVVNADAEHSYATNPYNDTNANAEFSFISVSSYDDDETRMALSKMFIDTFYDIENPLKNAREYIACGAVSPDVMQQLSDSALKAQINRVSKGTYNPAMITDSDVDKYRADVEMHDGQFYTYLLTGNDRLNKMTITKISNFRFLDKSLCAIHVKGGNIDGLFIMEERDANILFG